MRLHFDIAGIGGGAIVVADSGATADAQGHAVLCELVMRETISLHDFAKAVGMQKPDAIRRSRTFLFPHPAIEHQDPLAERYWRDQLRLWCRGTGYRF